MRAEGGSHISWEINPLRVNTPLLPTYKVSDSISLLSSHCFKVYYCRYGFIACPEQEIELECK